MLDFGHQTGSAPSAQICPPRSAQTSTITPPVRSTPVVELPRGLLFSIEAIAVADDANAR